MSWLLPIEINIYVANGIGRKALFPLVSTDGHALHKPSGKNGFPPRGDTTRH